MAERHTIASDEDAFALLARLVEGQPLGPDYEIRFDGWPRFVITVKGTDFDGTIPTRIMPTLLELQAQVHRLYCRTAYGDGNLRRLSKQDKEALELVVRVERGSSFFETLLGDPLYKTLQAAVGKMSPEQTTIVVIVFAVLIASGWGWKLWLNKRSAEAQLDQQLKLSKLENDRLALILRAGQQVPVAAELAEGIDPLRRSLVANLKPDDRLEVPTAGPQDPESPPVVVLGADAQQLTRTPRQPSIERMVDDSFRLLSADFSKAGTVRVELRRISDDYEFRADVPAGVLDNNQERALRDKSWERVPLRLSVLVNDHQGRYTSAKVVSVPEFKGE